MIPHYRNTFCLDILKVSNVSITSVWCIVTQCNQTFTILKFLSMTASGEIAKIFVMPKIST